MEKTHKIPFLPLQFGLLTFYSCFKSKNSTDIFEQIVVPEERKLP